MLVRVNFFQVKGEVPVWIKHCRNVTRDYILKDKPDVIINIVDGTNIERNLYLTLSVMEQPVVPRWALASGGQPFRS